MEMKIREEEKDIVKGFWKIENNKFMRASDCDLHRIKTYRITDTDKWFGEVYKEEALEDEVNDLKIDVKELKKRMEYLEWELEYVKNEKNKIKSKLGYIKEENRRLKRNLQNNWRKNNWRKNNWRNGRKYKNKKMYWKNDETKY